MAGADRAKRNAAEGFWLRIIYIVSALICATVAFLILGPRPSGTAGKLDVSTLPTVNAALNAVTAVLLCVGYAFIRRHKVTVHKRLMLTAFFTSSAFLLSYVIYHWFKSGPKLYTGSLRGLYYVILTTHIGLAALIIPLALVTLYRGWSSQIARHRKIAKVTLPLWLYVSVTGVVIYVMLYV